MLIDNIKDAYGVPYLYQSLCKSLIISSAYFRGGENAYKNNYHIQGTTDKQMIFDDVRIPLKDKSGNNYNINKFGLEFLKFARKHDLKITRDITNNQLVITIK